MLDRSKVLQDDISQMVSTIGARMNLLDQVDEGHAEKGVYSKEVSNQIESSTMPVLLPSRPMC